MRRSPTAGVAMGALGPDKQCANLRGRAATDLRRLDRGTSSASRPECNVCSVWARSWHGQWHGRGTPADLELQGVLVSDRRPRQSSKRRRGTLLPRYHTGPMPAARDRRAFALSLGSEWSTGPALRDVSGSSLLSEDVESRTHFATQLRSV